MIYRRTLLFSLAAVIALGIGIAGVAGADGPRRIDITITKAGFTPANIEVHKGKPVLLAFTRKTDATCAKNVIIDTGDKEKIERDLPLDKTVKVSATFKKSGKLSYACGMGHVRGVIHVH